MSAGLAVALRKIFGYVSLRPEPYVSVADVHRPADRSVHVHVSEPGLHVAPDRASHHHIAEGATHVALHAALDRDVPDHGARTGVEVCGPVRFYADLG